jgi:hypothetical protein
MVSSKMDGSDPHFDAASIATHNTSWDLEKEHYPASLRNARQGNVKRHPSFHATKPRFRPALGVVALETRVLIVKVDVNQTGIAASMSANHGRALQGEQCHMTCKHLLGFALAIGLLASASARSQTFFDDFSTYPRNVCWTDGSKFGPWTVAWSGFGCVEAVADATVSWLNERPKASSGSGRSALTVGPSLGAVTSYTYQLSIKTLAQINSNPKPWQVGWALWSYSNPNSFYNVVLKPNGWELDKEYATRTGAQGQCFLASGTNYKFPIGVRYDLQINDAIVGVATKTLTVRVSSGSLPGQITLVTYTDAGACGVAPYMSGNIALYDDDAEPSALNPLIMRRLIEIGERQGPPDRLRQPPDLHCVTVGDGIANRPGHDNDQDQ